MAQSTAFDPTTLNHEIVIKGLTPETLAAEAGVHVATVYRALRGQTVRPQSSSRILAVLGRRPALNVPAGLVKAS